MIKSILIYSFLSFTLLLQSCSESKLSPEDEIRKYIETGVEAAENRNASDLAELMDDSYRDSKGLGKIQLIKLLRVYFFRHKNIFLFTKIDDITFHSVNEASVTLHVAMAGSVIANTGMLSGLGARIYRFELELIKQDRWLLQQAKWQQASANEMD